MGALATPARLADLARLLGGELIGDPELGVSRIGPLETADARTIAFLAHPRYAAQLARSAAACVIVGQAQREAAAARGAAIVCADPYLAYARLTQWWAAQLRRPAPAGVHPSAVIEPGARVHATACVGPLAHVAAGARIGAGAVVGAQSHVGEDAELGEHTRLAPRVVLGRGCRVGAHSAFAGCVGVAGSARIGRHCTAGGGAIILGHLELVDHVHLSAATVVSRSILKPGLYSGAFPFDDNASWEKNAATLRQLHGLRDRLRALERKTAP